MSGHLESKSNSDTSPPASLFRRRGLWLAATMVAVYVALVPLHTQDGANHRQVAVLLERLISADVQDPVYQSNLGLLRTNVLFSGGYALAAAMTSVAPKDAATWRDAVSDARECHRLSAALSAGAVDGVTAHAAPTIDGLPLETHLAKRDRLFALTRSAV